MTAKERAAQAALDYVRSGMIVGLGTGSTADLFLRALGEILRTGKLRDVRGVPTSQRCAERAKEFGIPLVALGDGPQPDITIDGADEVDANLDLIKGMGGALLREKIVAQNSKRLVVIVDASKMVSRLGTRAPLPVEVTPFGYKAQKEFLDGLGAAAVLRMDSAAKPFVTDNGNYIYDCRFQGIGDPRGLQTQLQERAGIVATGLFLGIAHEALVGNDTEVEIRQRPGSFGLNRR